MQLKRILINTFKGGELSNENYHAHKGISGTGLSTIYSKSVLSWLEIERKQSDALGFGIASHASFLEPELFDEEFYEGFDEEAHPEALRTAAHLKDFLGKHGQKVSGSKKELIDRIVEFSKLSGEKVEIIDLLKQEHDKKHEGKVEVSPINFKQLQGMRDRLLADKSVLDLVQGAMVEKSIICEIDFYEELNQGEPNDGQFCVIVKIRPDIVSKKGALVDYKTCLDCYDKFLKDIFNFNYDLKMALQHDVLQLVYHFSPSVTLLAQNKLAPSELSNPFEYKPWLLGSDVLLNGRKKYLLAIRRYCEYMKTQTPLGQGNLPEWVDMPNWASFTA